MESVIRSFRKNSSDYQQALALRTEVLRKPLGLQFTETELKKDEEDIHWGLFKGDSIMACLTLTVVDKKRVKMRQVAVNTNVQGTGLGKQLSGAAEKYAADKGFEIVFCHARETAVGFYKSMGYEVVGDRFVEVNIPHYVMQKRIN